MLVDACFMEELNHVLVNFDFHKGFQINIGDAGRLLLNGQQQRNIFFVELGAANLPHALANGRNAVQHAVIVAEGALGIALVGLANSAESCAKQAGLAALGEPIVRTYVHGSSLHGLQVRNLLHQGLTSGIHGTLNLRQHRQYNLLLMTQERLVIRQCGEELKPHQGVFLADFQREGLLLF